MNSPYLKEAYQTITPYQYQKERNGVLLEANESPFSFPVCLQRKYIKGLKELQLNRYPDSSSDELCNSIANHFNLDKNQVSVGVGSDDLLDIIFRFSSSNKKVLIMSPSFSMYQIYGKLNESQIIEVPLEEDFSFNCKKFISQIETHQPILTVLCNPNNPTGTVILKEEIQQILIATKGLVVIDEAYGEFFNQSAIPLLKEYSNLIVLKTFSKAFGLAGIRLGYALSSLDNIQVINTIKPPYRLNSLSMLMGKIAIENSSMFLPRIAYIQREKRRVMKILKKLSYLHVFEGEGNFIFLKAPLEVYQYLVEKKIYVRQIIYQQENFMRITIGNQKENNLLIKELTNFNEKI